MLSATAGAIRWRCTSQRRAWRRAKRSCSSGGSERHRSCVTGRSESITARQSPDRVAIVSTWAASASAVHGPSCGRATGGSTSQACETCARGSRPDRDTAVSAGPLSR
jgi:hypothetical protein